jgi:acyl carrier protein
MADNDRKMRDVLAMMLEVPVSEISDATEMDAVERWDSLKHLKIVLALEEAFDVSFDEENALEITSVPKIRAALCELGVSF